VLPTWRRVALQPCPSCRGAHLLDVHGDCARCRGTWLSGPQIEGKAHGRLAYVKKNTSRGPPTPQNCPWCRAALKAFDIPGLQHEGDLFYGKETPRAETHCIGEGCSSCGGVWMDAVELSRGGGRIAVLDNLARLAESLA
jgi:Zn-finger nucleic acid-binding protein